MLSNHTEPCHRGSYATHLDLGLLVSPGNILNTLCRRMWTGFDNQFLVDAWGKDPHTLSDFEAWQRYDFHEGSAQWYLVHHYRWLLALRSKMEKIVGTACKYVMFSPMHVRDFGTDFQPYQQLMGSVCYFRSNRSLKTSTVSWTTVAWW